VKSKIDNVKANIQDKEEKEPWSRPTLARHLVFGHLAASLTSFPLEESLCLARQVSAPHDKSSPDWCVGPDARLEHHYRHVQRNESPCHANATAGGHAGSPPRQERQCWFDQLHDHHIAIISHSATRELNPRHSSTLYDAHKPRLRLGHGKLGNYSGRPRQAQTTRGGGQASRNEQSSPTTWRLSRQGITTWLQCTPTDNDVRRDVPATKHCNPFLLPLVPLPLRL
jgi:hypothetical protein